MHFLYMLYLLISDRLLLFTVNHKSLIMGLIMIETRGRKGVNGNKTYSQNHEGNKMNKERRIRVGKGTILNIL